MRKNIAGLADISRSICAVIFILSLTGLMACGEKSSRENPPADSTTQVPPAAVPPAAVSQAPKIIAFGDSLTAGYGLQAHENYPALLQERLQRDGFNYEVVNAGVSGETSAGGLRRIDWVLQPGVAFLILELGANDILRGQPVSAMKENLSQIIRKAQAKGVKVLLAGMEAPTNTGPEYRRQVHEAFPALAAEHQVPLIPFFLERVAGISTLNLPDGIHPNAAGTEIIAETVYRALKPMLEEHRQATGG